MTKSKLFLILTLITFTTLINGQNKFIYSVSTKGGIISPADAFGAKTGWNAGFDFELRKKNVGVFVNNSYGVSPLNITTIEMEYVINKDEHHFKLFEVSLGTRAYIGNINNFNGHIEAGIGLYGHTYSSTFKKYFGFNIGGGLSYPVAQKIDILTAARFHINEKFTANNHLTYTIGTRYYFNK